MVTFEKTIVMQKQRSEKYSIASSKNRNIKMSVLFIYAFSNYYFYKKINQDGPQKYK